MPHSPPRRPQHDSSTSSSHHHARKSPTMFELGQLADDNNSAAASEDSNPIIWEDDAGTDLRHLFTRRGGNNDSNDDGGDGELLPTMTQQVDEMMLRMEDSDDSSDDDKVGTTNNDDANTTKNNSMQHSHSTYTPPAAATRSGRNKKQKLAPLLDSGDVLATISKVKRRRRRNDTADNSNDADNKNGNNNSIVVEEVAGSQKLSAKQEVDRVFDLLGLPPDTSNQKDPSDNHNNNDHDSRQQQHLLSSQNSYAIHNNKSQSLSAQSSFTANTAHRNEQLKGRRLTFPDNKIGASNNNDNDGGKRVKRHHSLPLGERSSGPSKMIGGRLLHHEDTTISVAAAAGSGGGEFGLNPDFGNGNPDDHDDDDGVENLLKEIEQGLDQVCSGTKGVECTRGEKSGSCPQLTTATSTTITAAAATANNHPHPVSASNNVSREEKKVGSSSSSSIQPFGIKNANAANTQRQSTISTSCDTAKNGMELLSRNNNNSNINNNNNASDNIRASSTGQPCLQPEAPTSNNKVNEADNANYDFDNDDLEEYMKGLSGDATTSSSQGSQACSSTNNSSTTPVPATTATTSSVIPCPPPPITTTIASLSNNEVPLQSGNGSYDFLDNDNDDELLANVDLSGTQQCLEEKQTTNTEADDDDVDFDMDVIDFSALDKQVEQRLETIGDLDVAVAVPPPNAPIFNRRCGPNPNMSKEPHFLSFTRYVVRRVKDDLNTYTKTIDVSLWTPTEENGREGEMERLKKICSSSDTSTNDVAIDGCIHLRGEWYHTNAKSGDVIHLGSISGTYLTDATALPVILHSNPPAGSDVDDDLVLVIHPDELITPTLVSEAVKCPRLAVLQSRLGSTGLSAKSAVIGTLRHDLFERCLREKDTSRRSAALFTRDIIRNNAEALVGCGVTDRKEAFGEVIKTLPQIQR
eukprot:scaffold604_cov111-Skeletonema_dohrnii-CCMP3373.AAC.8